MAFGFDVSTEEMFEALSKAQEFVEKNGVDALKAWFEQEGISADIKYNGKDLKINFIKK